MPYVNKLPANAPLKKGQQVLCENAEGVRRYMSSIALKEVTKDEDGNASWWPVRSSNVKTPVAPKVDKTDDDKKSDVPEHTTADMIELIKATTTEEEAQAVVGKDDRKTVINALAKHIKHLNEK